ncbi:hypothetical protein MJ1_0044 [Nanobdella aerobiophila]|uniref:Uncharacterized protein n=1 Tax=Nanobdella aerobiophila TaxID=2586965 RepID=A0A915SCA8_9ARCH|nr:hypothetical protein [Nanobdella aerobiophila]BBL45223.1 hypothetical protein MJ1_0044 [Nanobdella aerobiophila]
MAYHKGQISTFLVAIIIFIVALVVLTILMIFYFKGGVHLFNSINETNGTVIENQIQNNNLP